MPIYPFFLFSNHQPGHFERLALDRELTMDCLHYYNKKNPVRDPTRYLHEMDECVTNCNCC